MADLLPDKISALTPRGSGHQFVLYGDACSGVPGAPHEQTFAAVNAVVSRLSPPPEFIIFPGDEIIGLTADENRLRAQWYHWFEVEMGWLDRAAIPLYHTTGNHTVYDAMSERVFAETLGLPRNGPPGQEGLTYFVRHGDLLLVFVNTCTLALGGEGHVESDWLATTLEQHADAKFKLVIGHHPVFPVNGYAGACQRQIAPDHADRIWQILVQNGVFAYLCSHILAFDVQVHHGVLQILTAGAGTAHRMPEGVEYLHCVQAAIDSQGLRYQVLETDGRVRESLAWPFELPDRDAWQPLSGGTSAVPKSGALTAWRFTGTAATGQVGQSQTLLAAWSPGPDLAPLWIGLTGADQRLTVQISPQPGRSPHGWYGPSLTAGEPFDFQVVLHAGMGPGGVLCRTDCQSAWTSLQSASSWGVERLTDQASWSVGFGKGGANDFPFRGEGLRATCRTGQG